MVKFDFIIKFIFKELHGFISQKFLKFETIILNHMIQL